MKLVCITPIKGLWNWIICLKILCHFFLSAMHLKFGKHVYPSIHSTGATYKLIVNLLLSRAVILVMILKGKNKLLFTYSESVFSVLDKNLPYSSITFEKPIIQERHCQYQHMHFMKHIIRKNWNKCSPLNVSLTTIKW